jgi:SAM-dependent methyltransferase
MADADDAFAAEKDPAAVGSAPVFRVRRRVTVTITISLLLSLSAYQYLAGRIEDPDLSFVSPPGGDIMYVPTPQDVVDRMLELAQVSKDDLLYDLGCGDGRVLVTASKKYGCQSRGYDIDPNRVRDSRRLAKEQDVEHLVTIEQKNVFTLDLSDADVVFVYLGPQLNARLIPQFQKLKPGARIVSHMFEMPGVRPEKVLQLDSNTDNHKHPVFLWSTPLKMEAKKR